MRGIRSFTLIFAILFAIILHTGVAFADQQTHTVQPGETLFRIALRYGVTVEALVAANNLVDASRIYAGQQLIIPDGSTPTGQAPAPQAPPATPVLIYHTVAPGQTLNQIAQLYGVSIQAIATANAIYNTDSIQAGTRLIIPGATSVVQPQPAQPTAAPTLAPQVPQGSGQSTLTTWKTHVVQPGEGLAQIARLYGVDWQIIATANNITDPNRIFTGTVLKIPTDGSGGTAGMPLAPGPVGDGPTTAGELSGKVVKVVLHEQRVYLYENGQLLRSIVVSTGMAGTPTVIGTFKIYVKYSAQLMYGPGYYLPGVPWVMYFYQGYGLHGTYWHHNFGTPMSHGCVNLPTPDAKWIYDWAPVGTPVTVVW